MLYSFPKWTSPEWITYLPTSCRISFHQLITSFLYLHLLCLYWELSRQQIFLPMSSVSSYITSDEVSNLFPHLQNVNNNPCLTRVWIKWVAFINHLAHVWYVCSPNKYIFLSNLPIQNQITSKDSVSQSWLYCFFLPFLPDPDSSALICSSAHSPITPLKQLS